MRLWTELVSLRGWPSLRRALLAALVLVMVMLEGGASLRQAQAQNQSVSVRMPVFFSPYTQPPLPGEVCKNKDYVIFADPTVDLGGGIEMDDFYQYNALVRVIGTGLGTIGPNPYLLGPASGAARFTYRAGNTGQETLRFTAEMIRPVTYQIDGRDTLIQKVDETFQFEVVECAYKVSMKLQGTFASAGTSGAAIGIELNTELVKKEGGTFEGIGSFFAMEQYRNVPGCVFELDDFEAPTRITGKILENTDTLELTFDLGKGTYSATGACPAAGSATSSHTVDVAQLVKGRSKRFPSAGGTKTVETAKIPAWSTTFTITLEQLRT
jgi:hypothetical protein